MLSKKLDHSMYVRTLADCTLTIRGGPIPVLVSVLVLIPVIIGSISIGVADTRLQIGLLIGNQNDWLSGGQEAIPYQKTEVST